MKFSAINAVAILLASSILYGCPPQHSKQFSVMSRHNPGAWLGVSVQDVNKQSSEKKKLTVKEGAYVTDVVEDSPADRAGIQEGDVIVKVDDKEISGSNDLTKAVGKTPPGTKVKIDLVRGDERKTFTVPLGKMPRAYAYSFGLGQGFSPMPLPRIPRVNVPGAFFGHSESNGLVVQDLTKQLAEYFELPDKKGALVVEVKKGSEADQAGLRAGDVITKIGETRIHDAAEVVDELNDIEDSTAVAVEVVRKGKPLTLKMKIEAEDDDDSSYNSQFKSQN